MLLLDNIYKTLGKGWRLLLIAGSDKGYDIFLRIDRFTVIYFPVEMKGDTGKYGRGFLEVDEDSVEAAIFIDIGHSAGNREWSIKP